MTPSTTDDASDWPDPDPGQIAVMLLGTYHMDNPGLDVVNVDADDVLEPERQRELRALADRLERWAPGVVAVERPRERQDDLDALYEEYRSGERTYDEESAVDPDHPPHEAPVSECRSEVVQVGFRLADRLGHERVHAVDHPPAVADDGAEDGHPDLEALNRRARSALDVSLPDPEAIGRESDEHLAESTVVEHLHWTNREANLHQNHDLMFAGALAGTEEHYSGSRFLAWWYERNLRMVENLWAAVDDDTDRVLQVVGSGHVHVLRHLLSEAPMFCPASPLAVLDGGADRV